MKKRFLSIAVIAIGMLLILCGCSTSGGSSEPTEEKPPLTQAEIRDMFADPDKYMGRNIDFYGKIFMQPEYEDGKLRLQVFADPENGEMAAIVKYADTTAELKDDEYIHVIGKVRGKTYGVNILKGVVTPPEIKAETIEVSTYKDAVRPTLKTYTPAEPTVTQDGYSVTVEKVEVAEKETRVYFVVENNGTEKFNLMSYGATIIQGGKQYDIEYNWFADYDEVQDNISVGVTSSGIVCFPPIGDGDFRIEVEGYTDFMTGFDTFVFDVSTGAQ